MTTQELGRINVLAAKGRTEQGLTDEEKAEQTSLRQRYIDEMKSSLRAQLNNIEVQNEDGSITPLRQKPEADAKKSGKKGKAKQD